MQRSRVAIWSAAAALLATSLVTGTIATADAAASQPHATVFSDATFAARPATR